MDFYFIALSSKVIIITTDFRQKLWNELENK